MLTKKCPYLVQHNVWFDLSFTCFKKNNVVDSKIIYSKKKKIHFFFCFKINFKKASGSESKRGSGENDYKFQRSVLCTHKEQWIAPGGVDHLAFCKQTEASQR